jgi:hypothetical protein
MKKKIRKTSNSRSSKTGKFIHKSGKVCAETLGEFKMIKILCFIDKINNLYCEIV